MNFTILISLIIITLFFESQALYSRLKSANRQKKSLLNYQNRQCSYGGGLVNNSTVIELGNCFNDFYFIGLNIGTPGQYFEFLFDTGSDTLWIPLQQNGTGFNPIQSKTYHITSEENKIEYANGQEINGYRGYDKVSIKQTNISYSNDILFVKKSSFDYMQKTQVLGLVGMDVISYNFLDIALYNRQISTNIFSLSLKNTGQTSLMYYNNGLPPQIQNQTIWLEVDETQYLWEVQMNGFSIGQKKITEKAGKSVIFDSGTSFITLNQNLYRQIIKQYFNDCQQVLNYYLCSCKDTHFPQLSFLLNDTWFFVPGSAYNSDLGNGSCLLQLQMLPKNDHIILGGSFFRQYVITFDKENSRLGLYDKNTSEKSKNLLAESLSLCLMVPAILISTIYFRYWKSKPAQQKQQHLRLNDQQILQQRI